MQVPSELLNYRQWVLWRRTEANGRLTKMPISPWSGKAGACDKPQTWSTYRHVCYARWRYHCDGIGFVFTEADPFCGIDLDHCRTENGVLAPAALDLIKRLGSYTELSPSGTGAHILIQAQLPGRGRRSGQIEIYDSARYFTITGKHLPGTPLAIHNRQEALDKMIAELFTVDAAQPNTVPTNAFGLSDEELLERAWNGLNGDRFSRLWTGDLSDYAGDHSRADFALCRLLAFWCGGDSQCIDRLFRRSGLMREKWDRSTGDGTYASLTIKAATNRWLKRG